MLGIQNSYLSDFNPNYNDVTNIQNQGFGLTNNISFSVPLNNLILSTELFRYWHIEKSYLSYLKITGKCWVCLGTRKQYYRNWYWNRIIFEF